MIPRNVILNRADACAACATPCALQRSAAAHADPCAVCALPRPAWPAWGCGRAPVVAEAPALPPPADGLSPLRRRVRTYRRAGVMVGADEFLRRRDACRGCDLARRLATHPGLYGCSACTSCTGGPERLLVEASVCKRGSWRG